MITDNRKSFLELKVIWKDDSMIELKIATSNIYFQGTTNVYDNPESLLKFAFNLNDFPVGEKSLFYEAGGKDSYSYFSMMYYPIDKNGHVGVEINLESNVNTKYRKEEKSKLKLEIIVEPNSIDNFKNELIALAKNEEGAAILYGQDNRLET